MADFLLFTCEHGGNDVPARYRHLFHDLQKPLATHAGYDIGALLMAREFARSFKAPLLSSTTTRLLVDLNRSSHHRRLHADPVRKSSREVREQILADHYLPYRRQVEDAVAKTVARGRRVIHVSAHSFTSELNGKIRNADVGLLYDPARAGEARLCAQWKGVLGEAAPELRIRRNYPYEGKDDGFMPYLRKKYPPAAYVGIEVEVNQAIVLGPPRRWARLRLALIESLREVLKST